MIRYEQQPKTSEEVPAAVKMITDDANAEMVELETIVQEAEFGSVKLPDNPEEDGTFHILIPGEDVGEFADAVWDIDNGQLENLTDEWNQAALKAAEENA